MSEMDKSLENTLPRLIKDGAENLNSPLPNKLKLLSKTSHKESSRPFVSLVKIYQTFKEEISLILYKFLQKIEKERILGSIC